MSEWVPEKLGRLRRERDEVGRKITQVEHEKDEFERAIDKHLAGLKDQKAKLDTAVAEEESHVYGPAAC